MVSRREERAPLRVTATPRNARRKRATMLEEFDEVALMVDVPNLGLIRGQVGTVVFVYPGDGFEVEFVDDTGHTYALVTLKASQLLRLQNKPVVA